MRHGPFVLAVFVVAALFAPTTSQAQYSVGAGISIPTGDLSDEAEQGWNVQGSAEFAIAAIPFGLRLDLFYQDFDNVPRAPGINVSLGGEWFRQLGLALYGKYGVPLGVVSPYALLGGAWVREWHDDRSYSGTKHATFNLNAGLGFDVSVTERLGLFVEAKQLNLAGGSALRMTPPAVSDEVAFKSIPITVGVRF